MENAVNSFAQDMLLVALFAIILVNVVIAAVFLHRSKKG